MKEIARYAVTLGIICSVAAGVLAAVNAVTEPQILLQKQKQENAALSEVLPQAKEFKPRTQADGTLSYYIGYTDQQQLVGFVLKAEAKGYSSVIETLTGLTPGLEIVAIKVLSQNETPGLGSQITEPDFSGRFKGRRPETIADVQAITGATISSSAVIRSVQKRIADLKEVLLREVSGGR